MFVKVGTDRTQDLRDSFGRQLAYRGTTGDLPPFADGQPYDIRKVQVLAGNSTAYRYEGSRFARYGAYRTTEQQARTANSGGVGQVRRRIPRWAVTAPRYAASADCCRLARKRWAGGSPRPPAPATDVRSVGDRPAQGESRARTRRALSGRLRTFG